MHAIKPKLLVTAVAMALSLGAGAAAAQDASRSGAASNSKNDPTVLDSVEVSARGVVETLQETPIAVTAISSDAIERKGLVDMADIAKQTPGFSFSQGFGRFNETPVIRGMANISPPLSADINNASLFIDGIYVGGNMGTFGLEGIEQVEVLRGPQAAAFGRSTFAGAINYITRRPGSNPGGKLTLGFGNHGQQKAGVYYSGGSSDGVFGFDIGLNKRSNDAIYDNALSGQRDLGGTDSRGANLGFSWAPVDQLDIVARYSKVKTKDDHVAISLIGPEENNCYLPIPTNDPNDPPNTMVSRTPGSYCGVLPLPAEWTVATQPFRDLGLFPGLKTESDRFSLKVDYYFDNGWTLTSTSAYNEQEEMWGLDQSYNGTLEFRLPTGMVIPGALQTIGLSRTKDWSQGLRLASDQSQPVSGLFGVYYFNRTGRPGWSGDLSTGQAQPDIPGDKTTNTAAYAQVRWEINDQWTTSLEGRYAKDELKLDGVSTASLFGPMGPEVYTHAYSASSKNTSFTPRWTLGYQVNDNVNLFGLVSKGNKPGGFNLFPYYAALTDEARAELLAEGLDKVSEEKITDYEIGIKSDWLDNSLRLNATLYRMDWKNQGMSIGAQAMQHNGTVYNNTYIVNIGESQINGLELESQWAFAPGWLASLVYAYTDSEIKKYFSSGQADMLSDASNPNPGADDPLGDLSGHKTPLVPKNKLTFGLNYSGQFQNGWGYDFNWDTTYESSRFVQVANTAMLGSSTRSNVRFGVSPTETLRITAFVNNVTNDDTPAAALSYLSFAAPQLSIPLPAPAVGRTDAMQRAHAITPSLPRMYGVEVNWSF